MDPFDTLGKVAVIDCETTGLDPQQDRIVSLAVVLVDHRRSERQEAKTMEITVNPGVPIPADATQIHGIRDTDVRDLGDFGEIAGQLTDFIAGSTAGRLQRELRQAVSEYGTQKAWLQESPPETELLRPESTPRGVGLPPVFVERHGEDVAQPVCQQDSRSARRRCRYGVNRRYTPPDVLLHGRECTGQPLVRDPGPAWRAAAGRGTPIACRAHASASLVVVVPECSPWAARAAVNTTLPWNKGPRD